MNARTRFAAAVTAALVTLTACSGGDHEVTDGSSPSSASTRHDQQDVDFATGMVPHHDQAVSMAAMARTRTTTRPVRRLRQPSRRPRAPRSGP